MWGSTKEVDDCWVWYIGKWLKRTELSNKVGYQVNDPQQLVLDLLLHPKSMGILDLGVTLNLNGLTCAFEKKSILLSCSYINAQKTMICSWMLRPRRTNSQGCSLVSVLLGSILSGILWELQPFYALLIFLF